MKHLPTMFATMAAFLLGCGTSALAQIPERASLPATQPALGQQGRAQAPAVKDAPVAATLGVRGDKFTLNGRETFLLGASYYDGNGWQASDLDALRDRQFNLIRIFMDLETIPKPRTFLTSDGSIRNSANLLSLVRACALRGLVVDVTILNPFSNQVPQANMEAAVRNTVRLLKLEPNVFYDICNEHNHDKTGISHDLCRKLVRAAHAEHPGALVTMSSAEYYGAHWLTKKSNTQAMAAEIQAELDAGIQIAAPHFLRDPEWAKVTGVRVKAVRDHLGSLSRPMPIYLREENRRDGTKGPTQSEFIEAAVGARDAGAAGWVFHTDKGFNLSGGKTWLARLDNVERATVEALGAAVWGERPKISAEAHGPLRVHPTNPRYFTDGTKSADGTLRAVYLTGSHTWETMADMGKGDPPPAFDYDGYLDFLERHHHNFFRLWREENIFFLDERFVVTPHPWQRTGPDKALDGKPKFDLTKFNDAYFERLRSRVQAAGKRGIYAAVMLFEGWVQAQKQIEWWRDHPFHPDNNINGIDGDANGDKRAIEVNTLEVPAVTKVQEAYVRRVIETVGDLDNVLWEISNEAGNYSTAWQYHFIRFIKAEEAKRPKQHPVGMTFQYNPSSKLRGTNQNLFDSPADWISPNQIAADGYNYKTNPPPADGRKVIIPDTDHLGGIWGNPQWVWKSFMRGLNPIFMDPYDNQIIGGASPASWDPLRAALGYTRQLAERVNLAAMTPQPALASTGYCLANAGKEYLVYLPDGGEATVDLSVVAGPWRVEWVHPQTGKTTRGAGVSEGGQHTFRPPFSGPAVLYLTNAGAK